MSDHKSKIELQITLDEENIPSGISWQASDGPQKEPQQTNAFILSIWDSQTEESMRMDLWTKDMRKDQMDKFIFQTLVTMADSYERATSEHEAAALIRDLGMQFGEKVRLIKQAGSENDPLGFNDLPDLPKVGE